MDMLIGKISKEWFFTQREEKTLLQSFVRFGWFTVHLPLNMFFSTFFFAVEYKDELMEG